PSACRAKGAGGGQPDQMPEQHETARPGRAWPSRLPPNVPERVPERPTRFAVAAAHHVHDRALLLPGAREHMPALGCEREHRDVRRLRGRRPVVRLEQLVGARGPDPDGRAGPALCERRVGWRTLDVRPQWARAGDLEPYQLPGFLWGPEP